MNMTKAADVFTLKNKNGVEIKFIGRGGQIIGAKVPNSKGEFADVVIGYGNIEDTMAGDGYFGALCGRYANRIVNGKFNLEGKEYQLDCNNETNHLHGGNEGFNARVWEVTPFEDTRFEQSYKLKLTSKDGDQKYPGNLNVEVVYGLTNNNEFSIEYSAVTDAPTIINLTSHAYFNLKGAGEGTVEDHELQIFADKYTPISKELGTVSGEIVSVKDTAMDFANGNNIGKAVNSDDAQVKLVDGIDHNFVLNDYNGELRRAAILKSAESGRTLEVFTDQPGLQIYTGSHFDGSEIGKNNKPIVKWGGLAMETQIFPNSPNLDYFPKATLMPGETYTHKCVYKFS